MAAEPFGSTAPFAEPLWYSRGVTQYYGESHQRLRAYIRKYVDEELRPYAQEWEAKGEVPHAAFKRHAELGFMTIRSTDSRLMGGMSLPAGLAVDEWDEFHSIVATDEFTRVGYMGVNMALGGGNSISCPLIRDFGSEEQKLRFLPKVSRGEIRFCLAITEPDAGSDVSNIQTTAKKDSQGNYVVNGMKKWITNGMWAEYSVAAVRTGGDGHGGISLLIIPLGAAGVTRRRMENSGVHASGSSLLEFENVSVPAANLIGTENAAFRQVMSNFNGERLGMAIGALRLSRICAEDAFQHATTRHTFGQPLLAHGVIRAKFSNFGAHIEPAWAFLEQLVWLVEQNKHHPELNINIGGMTALLKVMATRTLEFCVREAQQVMGGLGYSRGGKGGRIEQISRDVRMFVVGGGSEEIMTELALKQEVEDLRRYKARAEKLKGKL